MIPQLVTLTGDQDFLGDYLDDDDYKKLMRGDYDAIDADEWREKYPELMGFLPLIPIALAAKKFALPAAQKLIAKAKGALQKKAAPAPAPPPKADNKMLLYAGIGAAALALLVSSSKRRA